MMRDARHLTPAERAAILAAWEAGEKGAAIAEEYHVAPSYPSNLAQREGVPKRRPAKRAAAKRAVPVKRGRVK